MLPIGKLAADRTAPFTSSLAVSNLSAGVSTVTAVATPEERYRLLRELSGKAIIENRTVVGVKPRPELPPFFESVNWCISGSDGGRIRTFRTYRVGNVGSRFGTFVPVPQSLLAGQHGLTRPHPFGTAPAHAS
jgi:hypothetical protein